MEHINILQKLFGNKFYIKDNIIQHDFNKTINPMFLKPGWSLIFIKSISLEILLFRKHEELGELKNRKYKLKAKHQAKIGMIWIICIEMQQILTAECTMLLRLNNQICMPVYQLSSKSNFASSVDFFLFTLLDLQWTSSRQVTKRHIDVHTTVHLATSHCNESALISWHVYVRRLQVGYM